MLPLVSIIMPCYNAERYIAQSIESVLAQTYTNWELLITDDCSSDNSVSIIKSFCEKDTRINLFVSAEHHGPGDTRNLSLNRANGRFIAFLDNDDIWDPVKLEKQLALMINNGYGFTYTSYELMNESGVPTNKIIRTAEILSVKQYLRNTIIGCSTVILNRDIIGDFQMFKNDTSDDMTLWLSLMHKGFKAYPLPEVLTKYRVRSNSASSNKFNAAKDVWRVYRECENLNLIQSSYNFVCYAFNAVKKRII